MGLSLSTVTQVSLSALSPQLAFHKMYKVQSFATMALIVFLSYLMPSASAQMFSSQISSAQVSPITFESTPTLPYSYNPTSEATIPPSYEEYSFLYPLTPDFSVILTSYKDTLNVSWEAFAPYHLPELFITCWLRNSSGRKSFSKAPVSQPRVQSTN